MLKKKIFDRGVGRDHLHCCAASAVLVTQCLIAKLVQKDRMCRCVVQVAEEICYDHL